MISIPPQTTFRLSAAPCRQASFRKLCFRSSFVLGVLGFGFLPPLFGQTTNTNTAPRTAPVSAPGAKSPGKPARPEFAAFKIISDRNIFNPHRLATGAPPRRESPRNRVRVDSFALVGTMFYAKGPHAFFEGSNSEYTKVAKPSDTIAGYTVSEILPTVVKLTAGTNTVELPVGMQMSRPEGGEWLRSARPEPVYVSRGDRNSDYQRTGGQSAGVTNAVPTADSDSPEGQAPVITINGETITLPLPPEGLPQGFAIPNIQTLTLPPNATPGATVIVRPGATSADDVLARLRARAAAERGDPQ